MLVFVFVHRSSWGSFFSIRASSLFGFLLSFVRECSCLVGGLSGGGMASVVSSDGMSRD